MIRHQVKAIITKDVPVALMVAAGVLAVAALMFATSVVVGAEPAAFEVVNKCQPQFVVIDKTGRGCICGDKCACKAGDCPAKCPVQTTADGLPSRLTFGGVPHDRGADGVYRPVTGFAAPQQTFAAPVSSGCANGQCGAPTQRRGLFR